MANRPIGPGTRPANTRDASENGTPPPLVPPSADSLASATASSPTDGRAYINGGFSDGQEGYAYLEQAHAVAALMGDFTRGLHDAGECDLAIIASAADAIATLMGYGLKAVNDANAFVLSTAAGSQVRS